MAGNNRPFIQSRAKKRIFCGHVGGRARASVPARPRAAGKRHSLKEREREREREGEGGEKGSCEALPQTRSEKNEKKKNKSQVF